MGNVFAITGADIGVGPSRLIDHALQVNEDGRIGKVCPIAALPPDLHRIDLPGGKLIAGCIDLQVNGGGGVLFNNDLSVAAIDTICRAHQALGTCRVMITLISSTAQNTTAAITAAIAAHKKNIPGFLGLHLEGPHLSPDKKGAHNQAVLRSMTQIDLDELCTAKQQLPYLMVTVAPEMVTNTQIEIMSNAGIVVSLGHSNANCADAVAAYQHGARCATHLFNAMSPLTAREPGMVGAALSTDDVYAGLIADGIHVDAAAIKIALGAKKGDGKMFVVSDAMATAGSSLSQFKLDGRTIVRKQNRLALLDGTLAGAHTDMLASIRYLTNSVGLDEAEAVRMATSYPSRCIGALDDLGLLEPGHCANVLHVDKDYKLLQVWVDGKSQMPSCH